MASDISVGLYTLWVMVDPLSCIFLCFFGLFHNVFNTFQFRWRHMPACRQIAALVSISYLESFSVLESCSQNVWI